MNLTIHNILAHYLRQLLAMVWEDLLLHYSVELVVVFILKQLMLVLTL
jgi:hypothetical protein